MFAVNKLVYKFLCKLQKKLWKVDHYNVFLVYFHVAFVLSFDINRKSFIMHFFWNC